MMKPSQGFGLLFVQTVGKMMDMQVFEIQTYQKPRHVANPIVKRHHIMVCINHPQTVHGIEFTT